MAERDTVKREDYEDRSRLTLEEAKIVGIGEASPRNFIPQ